MFSGPTGARACVSLTLTWVVFSPYVGAFLSILTLTWVVLRPYVGCFQPLRRRVLVYFQFLPRLFFALTWARACVSLTLTWVVFSPYVGTCLSIFNPYVGCFQPFRGRVAVNYERLRGLF